MLDRADSCRPKRRSALIAHELSRLNIDIAALSEVRFSGEGSLQEHGAGYTLLVRQTGNRETPIRCWFHGQELHCLQACKSANGSFRPHHLHAPTALEPAICHALQCVLPDTQSIASREGQVLF